MEPVIIEAPMGRPMKARSVIRPSERAKAIDIGSDSRLDFGDVDLVARLAPDGLVAQPELAHDHGDREETVYGIEPVEADLEVRCLLDLHERDVVQHSRQRD